MKVDDEDKINIDDKKDVSEEGKDEEKDVEMDEKDPAEAFDESIGIPS